MEFSERTDQRYALESRSILEHPGHCVFHKHEQMQRLFESAITNGEKHQNVISSSD